MDNIYRGPLESFLCSTMLFPHNSKMTEVTQELFLESKDMSVKCNGKLRLTFGPQIKYE